MSAILETQKAVYAKLAADTTLAGMISGIYDYVPQSAVYSYITIGDSKLETSNFAVGKKAYQIDLSISAYSINTGRKEVLLILERVRQLLDNTSLVVSGYEHVKTFLVQNYTTRNKATPELSGTSVFRIIISA